MKHWPFTFFLLFALINASCRKDNSTVPDATPSSYVPLGTGTERTYKSSLGTTSKETVTGNTAVFDGKTYNEVSVTGSNGSGSSKSYYYAQNGIYKMRAASVAQGITLELEFLHEKEKPGFTWQSSPTASGQINGVPAKLKGTIKEKGISKTVNGKTFNNVIHTSLELQYDLGMNGFETLATYEIYVAKGVGIVLMESTLDFFGYKSTDKSELIDYTIK